MVRPDLSTDTFDRIARWQARKVWGAPAIARAWPARAMDDHPVGTLPTIPTQGMFELIISTDSQSTRSDGVRA